MPAQRFFLEVMYKGTAYSGFQVQDNTPDTIQAEVEKALLVLLKTTITLTGSSRTDTGVHAWQNFFHFDFDGIIHPHFLYKCNAILPKDITVKNLYPVSAAAHCRFDAIRRTYHYHLYNKKNPFIADRAYYFPYNINVDKLHDAAAVLKTYTDFTSFSKRNTQVKSFTCEISHSEWKATPAGLVYQVTANRFLRGMVRGLTGTMLQAGREKITLQQFKEIIEAKDCRRADFSVPGHGLFLTSVEYPAALNLVPLALQ